MTVHVHIHKYTKNITLPLTKYFLPSTNAWLEQAAFVKSFRKVCINHSQCWNFLHSGFLSWFFRQLLSSRPQKQVAYSTALHSAHLPPDVKFLLGPWPWILGFLSQFCMPYLACRDSVHTAPSFQGLNLGFPDAGRTTLSSSSEGLGCLWLGIQDPVFIPFIQEDCGIEANIFLKPTFPGIQSPTWEKWMNPSCALHVLPVAGKAELADGGLSQQHR